jgi:hypothetical protein
MPTSVFHAQLGVFHASCQGVLVLALGTCFKLNGAVEAVDCKYITLGDYCI